MAGTRRQRVKNKANALHTTINMGLKLDHETQAGQSERRAFQIKKRTVVGNNKSPEPQHSGKKEPSQMGIQPKIAPKTAQSLPRRLQSNFIANINAKTVMNMSMNNSKFNFDVFRNKTGFFLPFTGVDQAYLIHRPLFTRQIEHQKEKLNDFQTNKFGSVLPKSAYFDKQKVKLVYDCTHSFNQPMEERDCKLFVPPLIRKQNGAHINEKFSKYYEKLAKFYTPASPTDNTLVFESRFESGNLGKATQMGEYVYDLELRHDFNSFNLLLTQWYFFRVSNTRKNVEYTFNIVNLSKPDSSYSQGMKPLLYSEKNYKATCNGWFRGGYDIRYFQTPVKIKKISGNEVTTYTLSFKVVFQYDNDIVYLSHCYPYTYSDLVAFLNTACNPVAYKDRLKRTQLTRSIAGNVVDLLIITNLESSQDDIAERAAVILSSRVHPGESNASFIMEGII